MFLVLTRQDLARLSPELRAELQELAFGKSQSEHEEFAIAGVGIADEHDLGTDRDDAPPWPESSERSGDNKRVIDISVDEAIALLGNLSSKSIERTKAICLGRRHPL